MEKERLNEKTMKKLGKWARISLTYSAKLRKFCCLILDTPCE